MLSILAPAKLVAVIKLRKVATHTRPDRLAVGIQPMTHQSVDVTTTLLVMYTD